MVSKLFEIPKFPHLLTRGIAESKKDGFTLSLEAEPLRDGDIFDGVGLVKI